MIDEYIAGSIEESILVKRKLLDSTENLICLQRLANLTTNALQNGKKLILAGNGGSAADSQHLAAEFTSRFEIDRPPMRAIALTTDTSALTAISNDYGYEYVFSRQLEAIGEKNDVFIGVTTSGKSQNILNCAEVCKSKGIHSMILTSTNFTADAMWDHTIRVPSSKTARIQEMHILIGHILCGLVERAMFRNE